MQRFEDLIVWQRAHHLVLEIYRATMSFPSEELYGLVSQMRRAAVAIPANVVEGHRRRSKREFSSFVSIATGSLEEVKYYVRLSRDLAYLSGDLAASLSALAEEVGRMLHGLKTHIKEELSDEKMAHT